jgi:hypothetical protein
MPTAKAGTVQLVLGGVGLLAAIIYRISRRSDQVASDSGGAAVREGEGLVRSAGPEGMRSETRREWTKTDEASDESFPASDPPATY